MIAEISGSLSSKTSLFVLAGQTRVQGELSSSQRERPREASSFHWWSLVRLWHLVTSWDNFSFSVVEPHKAGSSMYGYGDFDGPGLHALVDEMVRRTGEPAYPLGPRFAGPRQGLAGGCAPSDPPNGNGT